MKTKLIALATALAMCFALLTGCTGGAQPEAKEEAAPAAAASAQAEAAQSPAASEQTAEQTAAPEAEAGDVEELASPKAEVSAPAVDPKAPTVRVGMLTILNMSEEDAAEMMRARKLVCAQLVREGVLLERSEVPQTNGKIIVTFYDDLESMLMALNAAQIDVISVSETVAEYLLHTNGTLGMPFERSADAELSDFAQSMQEGLMGESYSFMMMEDHKKLCEDFDKALDGMKADGTLDKLVKEQITDVLKGKDPVEIKLPPISGADTITVAVTGALPPMDYVGPIGMPVGFSTAVLAEISTRIHKNISVYVIDSGARASALASGKADVVFWTRTSPASAEIGAMSEEERDSLKNALTNEQYTVMQQVNSIYDFTKYATMDMPEGTIVTQPYYSGMNLPVEYLN